MNDTPQIIEAKIRAGYRPPQENLLGAGGSTYDRKPFSYKRYYCRLHGFYVNSHGYCPSFSTEPFVPPDAPKPSPYTQPELF